MYFGTERSRKRWEAMTPEQQEALRRIRAAHATPEFRAEVERIRKEVRLEFPPRRGDQNERGG